MTKVQALPVAADVSRRTLLRIDQRRLTSAATLLMPWERQRLAGPKEIDAGPSADFLPASRDSNSLSGYC